MADKFFIGYERLEGFAEHIDPTLPVYGMVATKSVNGDRQHDGQRHGVHILDMTISQIRDNVAHYISIPMRMFQTLNGMPMDPLTGEFLGQDYHIIYNEWLTEALEITKAWWMERGLPEFIDAALTLPTNYELVRGGSEQIGWDGGVGHFVRLTPPTQDLSPDTFVQGTVGLAG